MKKLVINLLLLISTAAFGSIYTPVFKNITNENGLANSTVRCITKDEDGFMWFGTYDGLCRYDGISIKIFRRIANSNNELNHNHISALFCNSKNQLFVGTRKGLNRYVKNFDTFRPVSYRESGTNMLKTSSVEITAIVEQSGNMLVATLGQGLLALDQHDSRFHQIKLPGNARQLFIHSMAFSSNDCVYLGIDDQGIYQYNLKTKITKLITGKLKQTLCFFYSDRKLFIGTNNGLFSYNEVSGTVSAYQINNELKSPVQFIHKDSRNILWVGTENKGIVLINTGNNSTQHIPAGYNSSALSSEGVYCMYIDKSGYIWIGTMRGGVEVWNPIQKEFQSRKNLLSKTPASNFINCFLEIKPQLFWLGTDGGNIQQYNLSKDRFEQNSQLDRINQIAGNTVICSVKDNAGNAWFGTYGNGLIKYNLKTNQFKRYTKSNSRLTSNDIWSLYIDKSGSLWIGAISGGGLFRYNPVNDSFDFRNIRLDNILVVTETKNDQLIIGNYSGVT
ncbi:MAG: two-component regulator propeller domain-containing protein, partial [Bacteroidota bacterium]|nr:two-component regulator propeller domain-containing protein [Bacteroidota bacterium]